MGLELKYPSLLFLLIPIVFLMYLYFRQVKGSRKSEKIVIGILRSCLFGMIIFALTTPQLILPTKEESVVFLADRSASFIETEKEMLDWLNQSEEAKKNNQTSALVSFADGAVLENSFQKRKQSFEQFNSSLIQSETNIEAGIQFASSILPKGGGGRIVLLSDGNETVGDALESARLLRNKKLELDYILLTKTIHEDMAVTKLDVPATIYAGEKVNVSVTVNSNVSESAELRISVNNKEIIHRRITVKEGKNEFSFSHANTEPGLSTYKAEIVPVKDAFIENNSLYAVSNVQGTPKVLIVQGNQTDPLENILKSSGLSVDRLTPEKLPTTLSGFLQYQSIVFNNVPGTKVTEQQMKLIEQAVKEFGTGFVMLGGEDSFGLGGYFKTPLEKILPVDMEVKGKKETPSLGLVIVIDRSGSMAGNKLSLAKEAAARSAELLRNEDTLGFIAFDDRPWVIVKTAPVKNKKKVIEKIRSVSVGGGTNIFPSLEMAYNELKNLKLQRKHIILLTDGQSAAGGDYEALIEEGRKNNITLSTVALGTDADRNLLEDLAGQGGGRFYDVTDASVIPSILSRETVMTTRTYIEDTPFYPEVLAYPEWSPFFKEGIPKMNAYIAVTAKQTAAIPLRSPKKDPILAQWQYGLGTTIAFTSDMTGKWSGDFAKWTKWPLFVNQLVVKSLPQYETEPFQISLDKKDGNAVLHLKESAGVYLPLDIAVVSQVGKMVDVASKPTAPGEYDVVFPNKPGMYFLRVKQNTLDGGTKVFQTGFSVPYSEEYLMQGTNQTFLKELASLTGGDVLQSPKEAFRALKNKPNHKESISSQLLLIAFFLLILEIIIRRLGFTPLVALMKNIPKVKRKEEKEGPAVLEQIVKAREKNTVKKRETSYEDTIVPSEGRSPKPKEINKNDQHPPISNVEKEERMKRLLDAAKRKK